MRYRRAATLVILLAALAGTAYAAFGAYVRATSGESLKRAARHVQRAEPERAREALEWLLWFEPGHPEALHLTALSYLRQQEFSAAIGYLERIGVEAAPHEDAQINLAAAALADRQFQRAEGVLSGHLARYPDSLIAARMLSGLLLTELRRREAVEVLEESLRRWGAEPPELPDHLTILRDLATAEFHPPLPETCRPTLLAALERHPDQPDVRLALGECSREAGEMNEAGLLLREALRQRPGDLRTRFVWCAFLIETGDLDGAETVLAGGPETSSGPAERDRDDRFWEMQSRIAERRGQYALALKHMDRAAALQRGDKEYQSRRARLLQRLERMDDARLAYARSHELARAELDLWNLSRDLGVRMPTAAECERVARRYETLGKRLQAEAWRRLAGQIEEAPPGPAP